MFNNLKAVFFDLDNTLFNHSKAQRESLIEVYDKFKEYYTGITCDRYLEAYSINNDLFWGKLTRGEITRYECRFLRFWQTLKDLNLDDSIAENQAAYYFNTYMEKNYLMDGAIEVLNFIKEKGFKLGLITNGFRDIQDNKIDTLKIRSFFDAIIISEDAGVMKPHPDIFRYALKQIGCSRSECVFIGDSANDDINGAENAGINSIWFNPKKKSGNDLPESIIRITDLKELTSFF
ncbi:YjjG family noncanonical pyrimidine nucleotidase [candidate division KSB1 bacterium]